MVSATDAKKGIVMFIDRQQLNLEERDYTPRELLQLAGEDPTETTLARKRGHDIDRLAQDTPFRPANGDHFVVFHNEPTPVS